MRYESIPNHITQYYTTYWYSTTTVLHGKTISYNTTVQKHNLCPTRAKNGRIVLWQWQHFMWHTMLHHVPHHTSAIPHLHTNGITMPNNSTPYHTTFPCQWQHFMWHPALSHPTHTLAFQSHLLPWTSTRISDSNWTGNYLLLKAYITTHIAKSWSGLLQWAVGTLKFWRKKKDAKTQAEQKVSGAGRNGSNLV